MKKLLQILALSGLMFAFSCQTSTQVENGQEVNEKLLVNKVKLPENLNEDFFVSKAKNLHEQQFSEESYLSFSKSLKNLTGEGMTMSYQEFMKQRSKTLNGFKDLSQPDKYISQVFSASGIKAIESIRDILDSAQNPQEVPAKFAECEQLINSNELLSNNEKSLLKFQLGFIKTMSIETALQQAKNGNNLRQGATATSCRWYQWGCVFYFASAGLSYVIAFYFLNPQLWPIISSLDGDISYIAKCCFCGCSCDTPCPPTFP